MTPERIVVIANHVQRELSVRLARRLLDMHTLPYIIVINPNFQKIFSLYSRAFMTLVKFPKVGEVAWDFGHWVLGLGSWVVGLEPRGFQNDADAERLPPNDSRIGFDLI